MSAPVIADFGELRRDFTAATQRLLGDTIALSDIDWLQPTDLPGWMRGHLATHLACHAKALAHTARQIEMAQRPAPWRKAETPEVLYEGARRSALEIQEDLDQSAGALMTAFDGMTPGGWRSQVITSQGPIPATCMPLARLNEVILHHVDLHIGLSLGDIEARVARHLLEWNLFRAEQRFTQVELTVVTDGGWTSSIGQGTPFQVSGTVQSLLGWLTGRLDNTAVLGAEGLHLEGPV